MNTAKFHPPSAFYIKAGGGFLLLILRLRIGSRTARDKRRWGRPGQKSDAGPEVGYGPGPGPGRLRSGRIHGRPASYSRRRLQALDFPWILSQALAAGIKKEIPNKDISAMEATPRFELGNRGFADLCLTTWLCRRIFTFS